MKSTYITLVIPLFICYAVYAEIDRNWHKTDDEIDAFYGDSAPSRGADFQRRSLEIIKSQVANFDSTDLVKSVLILGESLRKLAQTNIYQIEERIEVYDLVQSKLLATPGHARYFADEVERLIADPKNSHSDVRERRWYLRDTLAHLPSPETIQVLGSYLHDERYSLDPSKNNSGAYGPTSHMVATALRNIGLRESEEYIRTQGSSLTSTLDMDSLHRWWDLVKSGERTFSFKGQDVEYRFKPDGTWETIPIANPPDDGPQPVEAEPVAPDTREAPSQPAAPVDDETPTSWRWIWIPIALVLFAGFFGLRKFRRKQS